MPSLKNLFSGRASSSTAMEESKPGAGETEIGSLSPKHDGARGEIYISPDASKSSGLDAKGIPVLPEKTEDYDHARDNPDRKPKLSCSLLMYVQLTLVVAVFTVAMPTSLEYTEKLGGSKEVAGLMVGLVNISAAIFGWPGLWLMETIGIKKSQMVANAFTAVGCAMYSMCYYWDSIGLILVARFIQGIGAQGFSTQFFSRAAGINCRSKYFVMMGGCIGIGYGVGPMLGAAMIAAFNHLDADEHKFLNQYTSPGWLMVIIYLSLIVATWFFFEDPLLETAEVKAREEKEFQRNMSPEEKAIRKEQRRLEQEAKGPRFTRSELFGLVINLAIFAFFPILISCWEMHAFNVAQKTWNWSMEDSALYIGGLMLFIVPINLAAGPAVQKWKLDDRKVMLIFFIVSLVASVFFFDFFQEENHYIPDMVVWTIGSVIWLCSYQICRGAASSLITKQVPTDLKVHFNVLMGTVIYMCSRGVGSFVGDLFGWDEHGVHHYEGVSPNNVFAIFMVVALAFLMVVFIAVYPHFKQHRNAS